MEYENWIKKGFRMKKIGTINFINTFFYTGLGLAIPLYLIKMNADVEEVGFILSVIPLFMLIVRTVVAVLSETYGNRMFFSLQGLSEAVAAAIYFVASTPLIFVFAKIFEGASYSFFWAVNRTAIFEDAKYNKKDRAIESAIMVAIRMVGGVVGIIAAAFIITNYSFEYFFLLLCALGLVTFFASTIMRDNGKRQVDITKVFDIVGAPDFWKTALALGLNFPASTLLLFFAIPVFAKLNLGADYITIGAIMAIFYGFVGVGDFLGAKMRLDERRLFWPELLGAPLMILLPFSGQYFTLVLALAGISYGLSASIFEDIVSKAVEKTKYVSSAIALLHVPGRAIEFLVLFLAGVVYVVFGAWAPFALAGVMFCISVIMFDRYLNGSASH